MKVEVISTADLAGHIPAWEDLASAALEPNPFYEPWLLIPAARHLGAGKDLRFVLVYDGDAGRSGTPRLCGLFPFERTRLYMGLPISAWKLWRHKHCPLAMPLLRKDSAAEAMAAVLAWLASREAGCDALEMQYIPADGPFQRLLADQLHATDNGPFLWEYFTRALYRPMESEEKYFQAALSSKHRKAMRRRAEQLAEQGPLEFSVAQPDADIGAWIDTFLRIEAGGWKGRESSAMACQEPNRRFFIEAATGAFERRRLLMTRLDVGGKTIAQNCYFRGGNGSFHFKPAFDEEYARFSPGFHMECELIRYLHTHPEIEWMDSSTSSDNELFNRLFLARRTIQTLIVPISGGIGGLMVSALPCLRYLKRVARGAFTSSSHNGKPKHEVAEAVK